MDIEAYNVVKKRFDLKRQKKIEEANVRKENIFKKYPRLRELEDDKNLMAIRTTQNILRSDNIKKQIEQENLEIKLKNIDLKIKKELNKDKINLKEFEPDFDCKECNDTGIIFKEDGKTNYCACFLQQIIDETYKQTNMLKINEENFDTFDIGYYSDTSNKEKYGMDKSPRKNIEQIRKIAIEFADNIDDKEQKNLLFTGNTGLGKTFLTNAIAKRVIDSAKSVIYQTAPVFMDKLMEYKFSPDISGTNKDQYNKIFDVDLLIIDDLGTETMTNNKYTELFNIINTRLLKNKKIIISTNLTLNQLLEKYDERVISRLIGEFKVCKFIGDDIRLKKKRIRKDCFNME